MITNGRCLLLKKAMLGSISILEDDFNVPLFKLYAMP